MTHEAKPFELGKQRIEALSDGIFAIVMTLLVLEIHVPELPSHSPNVVLAPALLHLWPEFLTYAVSFVSLGVYWVGHHHLYHAVRRSDPFLLSLNILFFMFVSVLPFSTSVLNAFREAQLAAVLFGANLACIGWVLYLQWAYVSSRPDMLTGALPSEARQAVGARYLAVPAGATLTVLVCFWSAEISLAIYLLLLPLYMVPPRGSRRQLPVLEPATSSQID